MLLDLVTRTIISDASLHPSNNYLRINFADRKSDASSDEVVGHMTGLTQMYSHVASTPAEKHRVGSLLCRTMAYIVDNGFVLIDWTGRRTACTHKSACSSAEMHVCSGNPSR